MWRDDYGRTAVDGWDSEEVWQDAPEQDFHVEPDAEDTFSQNAVSQTNAPAPASLSMAY